MGRSLEISEVLQTLCEEVKQALECDKVCALLGDEVDGYVAVGAAGLDESFLGFRQAPGHGLGGHAIRAGRILVTHRYQEEGYAPPEATQLSEIRTCVSAPLHWDGDHRAFVSAGFRTPHPIANRDVELMEGFAELGSLACANAARHARVQSAAQIDGLTGCLNRDALESHLDESVKLADENDEPLSLALVDLDRFKAINDVFGHPSGDTVLQKVGSALRSSVRAATSRLATAAMSSRSSSTAPPSGMPSR